MSSRPWFGGMRGRAMSRMVHRHQPPPPTPADTEANTHVVDCGIYVDGRRVPGVWSHAEAIEELRRHHRDGFVWIGLHEPAQDQIAGIATTFGLHELAVEDAVVAHQRPKLEHYDDTLFMVLKTVKYVPHQSPETASEIVDTGEIMVFLGKDFVITVRHGNHTHLADLRRSLESQPDRLRAGPAVVLHAITDRVVDRYLSVTELMQADVDEVEGRIFAPRTVVGSESIYLMKREVLEMSRAVMPLAQPIRALAEGDVHLVPVSVRSYFRDVHDHLTTVAERVAGFDELLTTLVDATLAKISLQQNTDMRKITAWAAIISIPTMVAGIYGMNFEYMPELHWKLGYPLAVVVILVACALLYRVFRRNDWL